MEQNNHGGDLYKIAKQYGINEKNILDFSANINPLGLSQPLKQMLIDNIENLVNYPDPECNELRSDLSEYLGVPKEAIITGNGASEMIYLLFDVLRPSRVLIPAPCFSEYARAVANFDSGICYYELKEEEDFRLNLPDFLTHLTDGIDALILCNPNNPTSALISREELLKLIEYAEQRNINIIVDEAFIELTVGGNDNSVAGYLQQYRNLFIIRAATKILAIPGLRLGYVLGDPLTIQRMWQRKIPWSVNSFACGIGKLLKKDSGYFKTTACWLQEEIDWLYNEMIKLRGIKVFKPDTNFILFKILDMDLNSAILKEELIMNGILIRDASNFKFLDNRFVRIAIKERTGNMRFVDVFKKVLYNL